MKFLVLKVIGLVLLSLLILTVLPRLISSNDWFLFLAGISLAVASVFLLWWYIENIIKHIKSLTKKEVK